MPWTIEGAQSAAQTKRRCPYCDQRIRPCNMRRHIQSRHAAEEQDRLLVRAMEKGLWRGRNA